MRSSNSSLHLSSTMITSVTMTKPNLIPYFSSISALNFFSLATNFSKLASFSTSLFPKPRSLTLIDFHNFLILLSKIACKDNTLFSNHQIFLKLFLLIYKNNSFYANVSLKLSLIFVIGANSKAHHRFPPIVLLSLSLKQYPKVFISSFSNLILSKASAIKYTIFV